MLTSDFDFDLPPELIASEPLPDRAASRMLVVHRDTGVIEHRMFRELPSFTRADDLFVFNNTRVVPARFYSPDGRREVLWLETVSHAPLRWRCLVRPGKKFRVGDEFIIGAARGLVTAFLDNGNRIIEWDSPVDWATHGHLALPHYMKREDAAIDRERYQTVYGQHDGSIAAPTAGLHFTPELVATLPHAFVTLHVGVGTFQPVKAERVADHVMHSERYTVPQATADAVAAAKRVITVGTTATRTLESVALKYGRVIADEGETDIFIHPGKSFRVAGAMVTNFHLPKSSLIMLVSAFAGRELILKAYAEAVRERYRFFSYGDCMLII